MLSAEQNDSQSEEINVVDESQAKNRPVPGQDAEIRWKKVSLVGRFVWCAYPLLKRWPTLPAH